MSTLQGGINKSSPTSELDIIKHKRAALQQLIKLTSTLHQLHNALNSVILMGKSAAQLPEKIVTKFKTLTDGLKDKPTNTLQNTLTTTDQKIEREIKHMLEISQKSDTLLEQHLGASGDRLADVIKDNYHESVNDFKKKSQTSITLRIALKTRNALVNAFKLPVPESFIKNQIFTLDAKERKCKTAVKKDMGSLQSDVDALMKQEDCPEHIKEILTEIKNELKVNSEHFNSGKPIDEMPIIYESIELSAVPQVVKEVEEIIVPPSADKPEEIIEEPAEKKKLGFFKHCWVWLNSPINKGWKDTEK
jgi:hypothetical protein